MKKNILLTVILLLISTNLIEARGGHGGGRSFGGRGGRGFAGHRGRSFAGRGRGWNRGGLGIGTFGVGVVLGSGLGSSVNNTYYIEEDDSDNNA
jgi:hypothetical protein